MITVIMLLWALCSSLWLRSYDYNGYYVIMIVLSIMTSIISIISSIIMYSFSCAYISCLCKDLEDGVGQDRMGMGLGRDGLGQHRTCLGLGLAWGLLARKVGREGPPVLPAATGQIYIYIYIYIHIYIYMWVYLYVYVYIYIYI